LAPVVNGVLRAAVRALEAGETLPVPSDPKKRLALEHSLPDWLVAELWSQIGPERTEALAAASNRIPPIDLRCNRLRSSREALLENLPAVALEELPDGLTLTSRPGPLPQLAGFSEGHWCVQDRAAQRIAPLLDPQAGQRVLDACAAPGGKTTHIAELMGDQGEVVAVDVAPRRLQQVSANAERLGLSCIRTDAADATDLTDWEAESFDRVLLDVPCSGLGTLARHADARWNLKPDGIEELVGLQHQLLEQGARLLKPDGRLVYATCTVHPAENTGVVEAFVEENPDWQFSEPPMQLWPDPQGGDGFFAAVLSRRR
jgi:16S rRNA (cytosine967-C5)-methyltransferase